MKRRKFILGTGAFAAGSAGAIQTGAFTSVSAERGVSVAVANDSSALLALDGCDGPNGDYVTTTDGGVAALDISSSNDNIDGEGVNADAVTVIDNVFEITNQGTQSVGVWLNVDPVEDGSGTDRVQFYLGDDQSTEVVGQSNATCVGVGESVCVGLRIDTRGVETDVSNLLNDVAGDHELVVNADAEVACDEAGDGPTTECTDCSFDTDQSTSSSVAVQSTDASNFPQVSTFLTVDTPTGNAGDLTASDMSLCENGCQQSPLDVNFTSEDKPVDFVFLLDVTGSMGPYIDGLKDEITSFVSAVESAGIDAQYALYLYGDDDGSTDAVSPKQGLTDNTTTFTSAVDSTTTGEDVGFGNDLPEDGYEAILVADDQLAFRSGSQRVMIDITDASHEADPDQTVAGLPETRASAVSVLDEYTFIAVSQDTSDTNPDEDEPKTIANDVGGTWISLTSDFDPILGTIEDEVATSYRVRYDTSDPTPDGTTREVVLEIDDPSGTLYAVTDYTAPST